MTSPGIEPGISATASADSGDGATPGLQHRANACEGGHERLASDWRATGERQERSWQGASEQLADGW